MTNISYLNPINALCINLNIEGEEDLRFHGKQKMLLFIPWHIFVIAKVDLFYQRTIDISGHRTSGVP